jgi:hypothetical protein
MDLLEKPLKINWFTPLFRIYEEKSIGAGKLTLESIESKN